MGRNAVNRFDRVLVANRGAVAARVLRALREMGMRSVAVYSEADAELPYLHDADEAVCIGAPDPRSSYLNQPALLELAARTACDAVHPGYGFLSENAVFAQAVIARGMNFIGPSPRWIEAMGHKTRARELMARHGMPMCPSSGVIDRIGPQALRSAREVGYPVLIKPAGGGGGIGMLPARDDEELAKAFEQARSLSMRSFGVADLYFERLVERPRHVEFQILADRSGKVRHVYERDCSVQRRHQKVLEESPAPQIPPEQVAAMAARIEQLLGALRYDVIGTVEMLYTPALGFMFLEMNTRLQVEHAVTEQVTGVDLVHAQIRLAAGEDIDAVLPTTIPRNGHALQARIYAEDPVRFFPSPGPLDTFCLPSGEGLRVETGYAQGNAVPIFYDPMVAKIIAHGRTRNEAMQRLADALARTRIEGVKTNLPFLRKVLAHSDFASGGVHTGLAADIVAQRP